MDRSVRSGSSVAKIKSEREVITEKLKGIYNEGYPNEVRKLLKKFNATKISEVDPDDYLCLWIAITELLEEIENETL